MPEKIDLKKSLDGYSARRGEFQVLELPPRRYLAIDGQGDPNTPAFADAIAALYPVAYALKFASKRQLEQDYVVPPLEGLWWADDMATFTVDRDKSRWSWTLLSLVPDWVDDDLVRQAIHDASAKAGGAPVDRVRLEPLDEGTVVQTLHLGSFDDEGPVLAELHERFIPDHGYAMTGKHHELYLSDFRKTAPERLRTILRQPVTPAGAA
jgi:hypothetical protein